VGGPCRARSIRPIRSFPRTRSVTCLGPIRRMLGSTGGACLLVGVEQRSAREEVLMKTQAPDRRSGSAEAGVERRPFRRVVVARRVDSERPTRMWSLLLPPRFDIGDQNSYAPAPRPLNSRRRFRPYDEPATAGSARVTRLDKRGQRPTQPAGDEPVWLLERGAARRRQRKLGRRPSLRP
jgi:hypothetical protein